MKLNEKIFFCNFSLFIQFFIKLNLEVVNLLLENESIDANIKSKAEHKRKFLTKMELE